MTITSIQLFEGFVTAQSEPQCPTQNMLICLIHQLIPWFCIMGPCHYKKLGIISVNISACNSSKEKYNNFEMFHKIMLQNNFISHNSRDKELLFHVSLILHSFICSPFRFLYFEEIHLSIMKCKHNPAVYQWGLQYLHDECILIVFWNNLLYYNQVYRVCVCILYICNLMMMMMRYAGRIQYIK